MLNVENLDFVTCVNLNHISTPNPDGKQPPRIVYHGIYASQLYGTLFAIYGKFLLDDAKVPNVVRGIHLKLLNYKGVLNLGFPKKSTEVDLIASKNVIDFDVQAAVQNYEMEVKFSKLLEVPKSEFVRLTFNRNLLALKDFEPDFNNQSNLGELKKPRKSPIPVAPYFDTEFQYRDGIDHYDQIVRDGMEAKKSIEVFSFRCVQSIVNVVYY